MMAISSASLPPDDMSLDMGFVRTIFFWFAVGSLVIAPFTRDPLATVAGGAVPWLITTILAGREIPAVFFYFLMMHWTQAWARLVVSWVDGESLSTSLWGPDLSRAYWYSLVGAVVLSLGIRLGLAGLPAARIDPLDQARSWRLASLFRLYVGTIVLSIVATSIAQASGGLAQPMYAIASLKLVVLFLLFRCALSSAGGGRWVAIAMAIEIGNGFTGYFSDFKECFIVLGLAAISARMALRLSTIVLAAGAALFFIVLLLFWTGVKAEYRALVSGYSNLQRIVVPLDERLGWLAGRALAPTEVDWTQNADSMLRRIAYIDFFAGTISTTESAPEAESFPMWRELIEHVTRPRLLFPDKAVIDDTAQLERLVGVEVAAESRAGTSISVGYFAENFVDFGFPAMLAPLFVLAVGIALGVRYFLTRPIGRLPGEAFAVTFVMSFSGGLGLPLTKVVGPALVNFLFLALAAKFVWPSWSRWLK